MLKKRIVIGTLTAALLMTSGISAALADSNLEDFETFGTSWASFDLKVPGNSVHNSEGRTSSQTKTTAGALAGLQMNSSGGSELDVRTESPDGNGSWERNVRGGNTYSLDSPQRSGKSVNLLFSTGAFQGPVLITGNWRSN